MGPPKYRRGHLHVLVHVAGAALALVAGCSDDGNSRRLPPDTTIDNPPAAITDQAHATIAFRAGGVADRFSCQLDAGAEAACTSPFQADVADGDHTFRVRAALGTTLDDSPAEARWTVDTVAPDTTITSAPPALDNAPAPEFAFAGTDNRGAVHFECALDDAAFAACTSPTSMTIPDGDHRYRVRAIDDAGNVDPTPATAAWRLDSSAPDTMITTGPAAGSFTRAQVSFAFGSPDSPVTFECALDAAAFTACTTPKAYTLAEGAHTFAVRAKDPSGLVDPSPARRAWTVDLTPPAVAITSGPGLTNDPTPSFGFTVTGATTVECQVDGGGFASCGSPFTTAALLDGGHTFAVRGTDAAGNAASASRAFTIDTAPPTVTITPVASPNRDRTPSIAFAVAGGATVIECQVDGGGFAGCSAPFTPAALADGAHTVTIHATDAAGNTGTASTTFTIDATPPALVIDDAPPAQWPVNYFDFTFHTTDPSATLTCSLNSVALPSCASPLTVTVAYNRASSFVVQATDPAGNVATQTRTWTPKNGLVLHYPWEQGQTHNTSLLAQDPPYSPDGTVSVPVVGGWAGTAAGSPAAHGYKATIRPLSSSATNQYTASVWVRVRPGSNGGTIFSTLAAGNGLALTLAGRQVQLQVNENNTAFTTAAVVPPGQWVQIAVRTAGAQQGVQLLINGNVTGTAAAPTVTGFGPGQAPDLTVGPVFDVDLDDLRFYNRALAGGELCTTLVRGQLDAAGACVPLIPALELSFEANQIVDTGNRNLPLSVPTVVSFPATRLGTGLRIERNDQSFAYNQGFAAVVNAAPGHSFAFWFNAGAASDILYDFLHTCAAGAVATCGIRVQYVAGNGLAVIANGGATNPFAVGIPLAAGPHSVVVTEQKADANGTTAQLSIYVDGALTVLPIGGVNVYASPSDTVTLPHNVVGTEVDEYEFWPRDLSADPEMLCENGWDGEWNPASNTCLLTSN